MTTAHDERGKQFVTDAELNRFEAIAMPMYQLARETAGASKYLVSNLCQWIVRLVAEVRRLRRSEVPKPSAKPSSVVPEPPSPRFKVGDVVGSGSQTFVVTEVSGYRPHPRLPDEFRYYVAGDEEFARCGVWEHYLRLVKSASEPQGEPSDAQAEAEANRRWPHTPGDPVTASARSARRLSFRQGVQWARAASVTEQGENR